MSENENNSSVAPDSEKTVEGFYDHFSQAFVSAGDFKFEDAQFHLDRMKTLASHLTEPERPLATDFLTLAGEDIMGNQGLSIAKTSEDRQAALAHLRKSQADSATALDQSPKPLSCTYMLCAPRSSAMLARQM